MSKKSMKEPDVKGFSYDDFFNNRLSLPKEVKQAINSAGLDFRFINATEFRTNGNQHRSHWRPYIVPKELAGVAGATADGMIVRGDLMLGVREKHITKAHRDHLDKRISVQNSATKQQGKELRKKAREYGVSDETHIYEGYEDNE